VGTWSAAALGPKEKKIGLPSVEKKRKDPTPIVNMSGMNASR